MYKTYDDVNGLPPRIYRTPEEIRSEMKSISQKIQETRSLLNIRELLLNILMSQRSTTPEKLIPELEEAITDAKFSLGCLTELKEELASLEEELMEVKWLFGT